MVWTATATTSCSPWRRLVRRRSRRSTAATSACCSGSSCGGRGDPELAADLTAETFAAALVSVRRFDPARGPAVAWLLGIAD